MNLKDYKLVSVAVVVGATVLAQFPSIGHWITQETDTNEHIVTLVEGLISAGLVIFGAMQKRPAAAK